MGNFLFQSLSQPDSQCLAFRESIRRKLPHELRNVDARAAFSFRTYCVNNTHNLVCKRSLLCRVVVAYRGGTIKCSGPYEGKLMIEVRNLTKVFSSRHGPAISSVSFNVGNGEVVGFVGLNGAGKTTTIRIAAGVSLPTSGTVLLDGRDIMAEKPEASKTIGWVPETPNFEPTASALDAMRYFAGFYGINSAEAKTRSKDLLGMMGLAGYESRKLRTYSQGMKKRFSLAVSMLTRPQNFLFDELLNGLDPEAIRFFRELTVQQKKENRAILLSSHILTEIESLADRVIFIHRGRIVKSVRPDELTSGAKGPGVLRIVLETVTDDALAYLKTLGRVEIQRNTIVLSDFQGDSSQVNTELVARRLRVQEIRFEKRGLEDYFLQLIREVDAGG